MARALTVVPAQPVAAVSDALAAALAGSATLCVLPGGAGPHGRDWSAALHLDQPASTGVAALVATSGSTGAPQAVTLTAGALLASAHATLRRLNGPGVWLLALPVSSIGGLQVLVRSRLAGIEPVCLEPGTGFRPEAFATAAGQLPTGLPRYTSLVPTQLRRIVDAGSSSLEALAGFDAVLIGGGALDPDLRVAARTAGAAIVSTYGMTETSGGCVYDGIPLDGVRVESPTGTDATDGLRISGDVLATGYHGEPEKSRQAFSDGWFHTRDAGHVDPGGQVTVIGRIDDVIVSGGVNVSAGAVEAVLRRLPDIADVAVLGRPDPTWGHAVTALVVPSQGAVLQLDRVRDHVRAELGDPAAPRQLVLVEALPRLHSGKVDRSAAQDLVEQRLSGIQP